MVLLGSKSSQPEYMFILYTEVSKMEMELASEGLQ